MMRIVEKPKNQEPPSSTSTQQTLIQQKIKPQIFGERSPERQTELVLNSFDKFASPTRKFPLCFYLTPSLLPSSYPLLVIHFL